jgi:acetolactate synthase-1/2/3 large subunit
MSKPAQLMVKCLENEGVSVVFGIPGEENIRFVQALAASNIRYILTRHEQAAAFMAEMYGRVTGRAAVVSATLGPGAINMQLGVADATTNSTPMVAISAQVGQDREYKESHQYVDLVSMFAPITRWAAGIPTAHAIPEMFRKAFKLAETERPAAVYLAVPEHLDADEADYPDLTPLPRNVVHAEAPAAGQVARAVDILRNAQRPVVLAGHGAARADATAALVRFSDEFGFGVANTFHGKGVMPDDHPNSIGTLGFMRHDYVNFGFDNADVIIAVGYELQEFDPVRINPKADKKIIHIHRFPAEVDMHYSVDVGIIGDISASLEVRTRSPMRWPGTTSTAATTCQVAVCLPRNSPGDNRIRATRWLRSGWWPTPARQWAATTSCWSTPAPPRCGWRGSTRPTSATPAWSRTACPPWVFPSRGRWGSSWRARRRRCWRWWATGLS